LGPAKKDGVDGICKRPPGWAARVLKDGWPIAHRQVHPYLRYRILIGEREGYPLPRRLFWHGMQLDFMLSWAGIEATEQESSDFHQPHSFQIQVLNLDLQIILIQIILLNTDRNMGIIPP
jgi:hypothetical protein